MRAFKTMEGASKYARGYRTFYNFVRKHQGIGGRTPTQARNINLPNNWKELLIQSINR